MSAKNTADLRTILMWGGTQSGKSSLIAAALFDTESELPSLDRAKTGAAANAARLHEHWRDLREGRPLKPTVKDNIDIMLHRLAGAPAQLRDVRGGRIDEEYDALTEQTLQSAAAVLFILDFEARDPVRQRRTIDGYWNVCGDRPKALVFTKCELHFDYEHKAWKAERGWWQDFQELRMLGSSIERFGDAVFPTSVYGYHRGSWAPALTLGEFGEIRPFDIRPQGVARPFVWALEQMQSP